MSGYPKKDHSHPQSQTSSGGDDMMALLQRMQAQLGYLEKKIDMLIAQGGGAPQGERPFRKPFQKPFRPWDRNRSSGPSDGNRPEGRPDRPGFKPGFSKPGFQKHRPDGQRGGFGGPKKPFFKRRDR